MLLSLPAELETVFPLSPLGLLAYTDSREAGIGTSEDTRPPPSVAAWPTWRVELW